MSMSRINGRTIVLLILAVVLYVSAFFTGPEPMDYEAVLPFSTSIFFDALFGATTLSYILSMVFLIFIEIKKIAGILSIIVRVCLIFVFFKNK